LRHAEVMQYVQTAFQGQTATLLRTEGEEIEVNVVLPEDSRSNVEDLRNLSIPTPTGESILLSSIADLIYTDGPSVINRQNQQRGVSVTGDIFEHDLGSVISDIENRLETIHVPEGYEIHIGGQFEQLSDAFEDLTLALILAIFLVYAVMAIQFEKVMYPFIVMFTLPVTAIGVIIGLVVTGRPLSTPGFIGLIMLSGIVVNNAIVLIDYINTLRERGMGREEAILKAGPERLRPILMTMLTTVLAMTPLAIGFGEGAEMQAPMATVVIFGLAFSTLITLIFVPVMYIYIDAFTNWWKSLFIREHRHTPLDR
jgi:hydrophobic/amphiphilic exporter-1 (mainly G- bacteria), HAE1 family